MNFEEVNKFLKGKEKAFLMLDSGTMDYIVSRCAVLNGLPYGLILSSQAIEKILKFYLVLKGEQIHRLKKDYFHSLILLCEKVNTYKELDLSPYSDIISVLEKIYYNRYPKSEDDAEPMKAKYLNRVDQLFIYIIEKLPLPSEVKFSCGLYPRLFGMYINMSKAGIEKESPETQWILRHNNAIVTKIIPLLSEYEKVTVHLHAKKIKE